MGLKRGGEDCGEFSEEWGYLCYLALGLSPDLSSVAGTDLRNYFEDLSLEEGKEKDACGSMRGRGLLYTGAVKDLLTSCCFSSQVCCPELAACCNLNPEETVTSQRGHSARTEAKFPRLGCKLSPFFLLPSLSSPKDLAP